MAELTKRLAELEADIRYQELPTDSEPEFRYERGQISILLSAPHGAVHMRLGQRKEEDEYTAGMARLVAELADAHVLYARRRSTTDPNWDMDVPYKKRLKQIVEQAGIRFVLDLHGAAATRNFGIALGTMKGESCPTQRDILIQILEQHGFSQNAAGLDRLDVDNIFTGRGKRGQETIISYVWGRLRIPAAQFELHPYLRVVERRKDATLPQSFRGESTRIEQTIHALTAIVIGVAQ